MNFKVLIYSIGSLGDSIVSVPALRAVRSHFGPAACIHFLHDIQDRDRVLPETVLTHTGLVDVFVNYRFENSLYRKLYAGAKLLATLRKHQFDVVVNLLPSERPANSLWRDRLFFSLCGIFKQIGFQAIPDRVIHPKTLSGNLAQAPHEACHKLDRLKRAGISIDHTQTFAQPFFNLASPEASQARQWLRSQRQQPERALFAIGPGCKQPANAWSMKKFAELGHRLLASTMLELIVIGGPTDRTAAEVLISEWGQGLSSAGLFSVEGTAALLKECQLLIGLDTGSTHLAASVGVPCVVIQGARNSPGQWDPLGRGHSIVRQHVPCEGCRQFQCPKQDHPCMNNTTVDEVWDAVEKVYAQLLCTR
jgi:ADP-heptose:LPS heptosyltransferase